VKVFVLAVATGALFALGLALAGMTVPAKITAFLDVTGHWDPALAFVMVGAIAVYAPIARRVRDHPAPWFDRRYHWPTPRAIDARLVAGAAVFGIGWGISGYCPGPALVSLVAGALPVLVFVGAMLAGIAIVRFLDHR
jgi:uncharacterized protein